ncbi:MAG: RNA-processing protein [Candidatus Verstraetearchaeota archaeon]|nr:RNA-processing protein [Candidatus Verstraetearchaeota archaeon]
MGERKRPIIRDYINIPVDRLGVIIGSGGSIKRTIEERTRVKLLIDSSSSSVILELDPKEANYEDMFKAKNVILAIAHGFSPQRAFRLFDEDQILDIINLTEFTFPSRNDLMRIKGRIIGERGKTRRMIEEFTNTFISVYDKYVAIIGEYESVLVARRALEMLINGAQHRKVYNYLQRERRRLKRREFEFWKR